MTFCINCDSEFEDVYEKGLQPCPYCGALNKPCDTCPIILNRGSCLDCEIGETNYEQ